jgi:hypothetical protein
MALGVDVGIDAHRHARNTALRAGDRRNTIQLARRFRVDGTDILRDRVLELLARLANARKNDVARREAGVLGDLDFAAGVRIGAAAERTQQSRDRQASNSL